MSKLRKVILGNADGNKDLMLLLIVGGLFSLSVALSSTFVNVYLWKQKSEYTTIALYNLFIVIAQPLTFLIAGKWAKQMDRIRLLRFGVVILSIFYLTVLLLGNLTAQYAIALGALLGLGYGLYWLAFNVLVFEITEPDTRDIFNGFFGLLGSLSGMVGPFFAGWVITRMKELTGYTLIFAFSLGLFLLAVVVSFFLGKRSASGEYELLEVLRWRTSTANWRGILLGNVAQGLREGSFFFLITIWVFVAAGSELALGTFSLVTSAVSFIFYFLVGRFVRPIYRKPSILIAAILLSAAVWIIAFDLTFTRLMIYGVVISIAFPILTVPFTSMTYDVIGKAKHAAAWRIEYIVARELYLNAGRFVSILLFIATVRLFNPEKALPYFILILGNAQLLLYLFIRKIRL